MFTRNVLGPIMTTAAILALSCLAVGQTMGGGGMSPGMPMPGMPTAPTVPGMHTASGMNGAAVAGAMGGVAAGAGVFYLIHRNHATLLSCVGDDGQMLVNEKDGQAYRVVSTGENLRPGERVEVKGKKIKDESGAPAFEAHKVAKDFGSCGSTTALKRQ
jgi:hypothetical protein